MKSRLLISMLVCLAMPMASYASVYTDDLSKCIVENVTDEDKANLVQWMFASASGHPSISSIATIKGEQVDSINKATADIFVTILTETCREQSIITAKHEGQVGLLVGFKVLGQLAANELFSNPKVNENMAGLERFADKEKLGSVFGSSE